MTTSITNTTPIPNNQRYSPLTSLDDDPLINIFEFLGLGFKHSIVDSIALSLANRSLRKIYLEQPYIRTLRARYLPPHLTDTHNEEIQKLSDLEKYELGQRIEEHLCTEKSFSEIGCLSLPLELSNYCDRDLYFVTKKYLVVAGIPFPERKTSIYILDLSTKVTRFFQAHLRVEFLQWDAPFLITGGFSNSSSGCSLAVWNLDNICRQENRQIEADQKQQIEEVPALPYFHYNDEGVRSILKKDNLLLCALSKEHGAIGIWDFNRITASEETQIDQIPMTAPHLILNAYGVEYLTIAGDQLFAAGYNNILRSWSFSAIKARIAQQGILAEDSILPLSEMSLRIGGGTSFLKVTSNDQLVIGFNKECVKDSSDLKESQSIIGMRLDLNTQKLQRLYYTRKVPKVESSASSLKTQEHVTADESLSITKTSDEPGLSNHFSTISFHNERVLHGAHKGPVLWSHHTSSGKIKLFPLPLPPIVNDVSTKGLSILNNLYLHSSSDSIVITSLRRPIRHIDISDENRPLLRYISRPVIDSLHLDGQYLVVVTKDKIIKEIPEHSSLPKTAWRRTVSVYDLDPAPPVTVSASAKLS